MSGVRTLLAKVPSQKLRVDLTSSTVATGAWTEILTAANNLKACTAIQVFYTGEGILRLSRGSAGSETGTDSNNVSNEFPFYIMPGGSPDMLIPVEISAGVRLSVRAVDQAVSTGELIINFFG